MDHAHEARAQLDSASRDLNNVVDDSPVSALCAQTGALLGIGHALLAVAGRIPQIPDDDIPSAVELYITNKLEEDLAVIGDPLSEAAETLGKIREDIADIRAVLDKRP